MIVQSGIVISVDFQGKRITFLFSSKLFSLYLYIKYKLYDMNNLEKEQFKQILNYLIETTKDGSRQWRRGTHSFNSDTCYYMQSFSDDKKTKFESSVKLEYDNNNKLVYREHGCMTIHNKGFGSGFQVFGLNDNNDILILEKLVFDNFVINLLPTIAPNSVFSDILQGMDKQYSRDKKLEQLLDGVDVETVKKKGFFGKLF